MPASLRRAAPHGVVQTLTPKGRLRPRLVKRGCAAQGFVVEPSAPAAAAEPGPDLNKVRRAVRAIVEERRGAHAPSPRQLLAQLFGEA